MNQLNLLKTFLLRPIFLAQKHFYLERQMKILLL